MAGPYYVRTTGNDSTGTGATGAPWLTISKALSVCVGGETVNVGAGTYAENTSASGRFQVTNAAGVDITVQTESGLQDVTVTGASDATINTIIQSSATHVVFKNLIFGMRVNTTSYCVRLAQCQNIQFNGCQFLVSDRAGAVNIGLNVQPTGAGTTVTFTCTNCSFAALSNANKIYGATCNNAAGNTITGSFINCKSANFIGDSIYFNGGTITITGGSYQNGGQVTHCVSFGADSNTGGNATTATISGASFNYQQGGLGHGLLLGNGCTSCVVSNCFISGEDLGLVLKEHTGSIVQDCVIYCGSSSAAYFKAATSCTIRRCDLFVDQGTAGGLRVGAGDTGNTNLNNTFTNNTIHLLAPTAYAYNIGGAAADSGGMVCDNTTVTVIPPPQGGRLGTVYGTIGCTAWADVITAWSGYSVPSNDAHSFFSPRAVTADYSRFPG